MIRFAALDFETANESPLSACALGVAVYEDGRPAGGLYRLIRPPDGAGEFRAFNTRLHGIAAADVADAPDFAAVWAEAAALVGDRPLAAHNAAFDMGLMRALSAWYRIDEPPRAYLCSYLLARRIWPGRATYSLGVLAGDLGIAFRHHDALEDARACGEVVLAACRLRGCGAVEDLALGAGLRMGRVGVYSCASTLPTRSRRGRDGYPAPAPGTDGALRGRTVVFTGTLGSMTRSAAARLVADEGGLVTDTVDAGVDYLVEGTPDPRRLRGHAMSSKSRRAAELAAEGVGIEILTEEDFLALVASGRE
ncbi:MAG: hypothetical protein KBA30_02685 [Clostridia bacterium]|nr:hypothetical protein [Clostridia bacterium]